MGSCLKAVFSHTTADAETEELSPASAGRNFVLKINDKYVYGVVDDDLSVKIDFSIFDLWNAAEWRCFDVKRNRVHEQIEDDVGWNLQRRLLRADYYLHLRDEARIKVSCTVGGRHFLRFGIRRNESCSAELLPENTSVVAGVSVRDCVRKRVSTAMTERYFNFLSRALRSRLDFYRRTKKTEQNIRAEFRDVNRISAECYDLIDDFSGAKEPLDALNLEVRRRAEAL